MADVLRVIGPIYMPGATIVLILKNIDRSNIEQYYYNIIEIVLL